jgi:predicted ATP-binding protein involved in virulence
MLAKDGISLRNFGYYQWDDETSCSSIWQIRYQNCYTKWLTNKQQEELVANEIKVLKNLDKYTVVELEKKEKELAALRTETEGNFREWNTILTCLKRFSEVTTGYTDSTFEVKSLQSEQRGTEWKLVIKMDDKSIIFDQLPAGYKRLYYIVFDIAYRSFILNGNADSSGVVLIDELDLHLHPSLEQEVLQRFMNTFPNIQFIVSTHSPLVISNLNTQEKNASGDSRNRVYRMVMGQKKPDILPNMFGVDYSTSMSDFMNTPSRNLQVKELIDDYVILKYQKLEDKAQNVYNKIMKTVGEDNQAVLAEIEDKLKELETL